MKITYQGILTVKAALKAVEQNGYALQFVKDQSEAICLKAVEQHGDALRFVLSLELFVKIAAKLDISISVPEKEPI